MKKGKKPPKHTMRINNTNKSRNSITLSSSININNINNIKTTNPNIANIKTKRSSNCLISNKNDNLAPLDNNNKILNNLENISAKKIPEIERRRKSYVLHNNNGVYSLNCNSKNLNNYNNTNKVTNDNCKYNLNSNIYNKEKDYNRINSTEINQQTTNLTNTTNITNATNVTTNSNRINQVNKGERIEKQSNIYYNKRNKELPSNLITNITSNSNNNNSFLSTNNFFNNSNKKSSCNNSIVNSFTNSNSIKHTKRSSMFTHQTLLSQNFSCEIDLFSNEKKKETKESCNKKKNSHININNDVNSGNSGNSCFKYSNVSKIGKLRNSNSSGNFSNLKSVNNHINKNLFSNNSKNSDDYGTTYSNRLLFSPNKEIVDYNTCREHKSCIINSNNTTKRVLSPEQQFNPYQNIKINNNMKHQHISNNTKCLYNTDNIKIRSKVKFSQIDLSSNINNNISTRNSNIITNTNVNSNSNSNNNIRTYNNNITQVYTNNTNSNTHTNNNSINNSFRDVFSPVRQKIEARNSSRNNLYLNTNNCNNDVSNKLVALNKSNSSYFRLNSGDANNNSASKSNNNNNFSNYNKNILYNHKHSLTMNNSNQNINNYYNSNINNNEHTNRVDFRSLSNKKSYENNKNTKYNDVNTISKTRNPSRRNSLLLDNEFERITINNSRHNIIKMTNSSNIKTESIRVLSNNSRKENNKNEIDMDNGNIFILSNHNTEKVVTLQNRTVFSPFNKKNKENYNSIGQNDVDRGVVNKTSNSKINNKERDYATHTSNVNNCNLIDDNTNTEMIRNNIYSNNINVNDHEAYNNIDLNKATTQNICKDYSQRQYSNCNTNANIFTKTSSYNSYNSYRNNYANYNVNNANTAFNLNDYYSNSININTNNSNNTNNILEVNSQRMILKPTGRFGNPSESNHNSFEDRNNSKINKNINDNRIGITKQNSITKDRKLNLNRFIDNQDGENYNINHIEDRHINDQKLNELENRVDRSSFICNSNRNINNTNSNDDEFITSNLNSHITSIDRYLDYMIKFFFELNYVNSKNVEQVFFKNNNKADNNTDTDIDTNNSQAKQRLNNLKQSLKTSHNTSYGVDQSNVQYDDRISVQKIINKHFININSILSGNRSNSKNNKNGYYDKLLDERSNSRVNQYSEYLNELKSCISEINVLISNHNINSKNNSNNSAISNNNNINNTINTNNQVRPASSISNISNNSNNSNNDILHSYYDTEATQNINNNNNNNTQVNTNSNANSNIIKKRSTSRSKTPNRCISKSDLCVINEVEEPSSIKNSERSKLNFSFNNKSITKFENNKSREKGNQRERIKKSIYFKPTNTRISSIISKIIPEINEKNYNREKNDQENKENSVESVYRNEDDDRNNDKIEDNDYIGCFLSFSPKANSKYFNNNKNTKNDNSSNTCNNFSYVSGGSSGNYNINREEVFLFKNCFASYDNYLLNINNNEYSSTKERGDGFYKSSEFNYFANLSNMKNNNHNKLDEHNNHKNNNNIIVKDSKVTESNRNNYDNYKAYLSCSELYNKNKNNNDFNDNAGNNDIKYLELNFNSNAEINEYNDLLNLKMTEKNMERVDSSMLEDRNKIENKLSNESIRKDINSNEYNDCNNNEYLNYDYCTNKDVCSDSKYKMIDITNKDSKFTFKSSLLNYNTSNNNTNHNNNCRRSIRNDSRNSNASINSNSNRSLNSDNRKFSLTIKPLSLLNNNINNQDRYNNSNNSEVNETINIRPKSENNRYIFNTEHSKNYNRNEIRRFSMKETRERVKELDKIKRKINIDFLSNNSVMANSLIKNKDLITSYINNSNNSFRSNDSGEKKGKINCKNSISSDISASELRDNICYNNIQIRCNVVSSKQNDECTGKYNIHDFNNNQSISRGIYQPVKVSKMLSKNIVSEIVNNKSSNTKIANNTNNANNTNSINKDCNETKLNNIINNNINSNKSNKHNNINSNTKREYSSISEEDSTNQDKKIINKIKSSFTHVNDSFNKSIDSGYLNNRISIKEMIVKDNGHITKYNDNSNNYVYSPCKIKNININDRCDSDKQSNFSEEETIKISCLINEANKFNYNLTDKQENDIGINFHTSSNERNITQFKETMSTIYDDIDERVSYSNKNNFNKNSNTNDEVAKYAFNDLNNNCINVDYNTCKEFNNELLSNGINISRGINNTNITNIMNITNYTINGKIQSNIKDNLTTTTDKTQSYNSNYHSSNNYKAKEQIKLNSNHISNRSNNSINPCILNNHFKVNSITEIKAFSSKYTNNSKNSNTTTINPNLIIDKKNNNLITKIEKNIVKKEEKETNCIIF